jgi:polyadenylate-binding protein 2
VKSVTQELFRDCGEINAITIPVDKHTGRAKGFAYLEFADKVNLNLILFRVHHLISERFQASIAAALEKSNSLLRDRPIKVVNKRTNLPIWQVS